MRWQPLLLLLATGASPAALASESQLWTSAELRYRPVKSVRIYLSSQLRLDQGMSHLDALLPELTASWATLDWLRLGGGYRYGLEKTKNDVFRLEHRLHVQASLSRDLGPVGLSYRLRYQHGTEMDDPVETTRKIRHETEAEFDLDSDFTPSLSVELFRELFEASPTQTEKIDLTLGLEIQASKSHVFDLFYRLRRPIAEDTDPVEHILGLGYQFRIRKRN